MVHPICSLEVYTFSRRVVVMEGKSNIQSTAIMFSVPVVGDDCSPVLLPHTLLILFPPLTFT